MNPAFCNILNSSTALQCPSEWRNYNNHCYKVMTDKVSWFTASSRCSLRGASLASINDRAENNFVKLFISNYKSKIPTIWLGLHKVSGQWKWTDGSRAGYKNWVRGEPNNSKTMSSKFKGENCAVKMYWGQWNDIRCGNAHAYICEKPLFNN
uniref:C-type lectin domain-containing protein n=1 Tax=Branchiostoma floridae TaxID=7739 RepID=C3ZIL7_BRAFL|eukprot:XP_002591731.1 hypothetical protein BRAFLDRAFT_223290 [Branchiostoma floridae]